MPETSWIVDGTYNPAVRKQIATVTVTVERRHTAGTRKKERPVAATIRDDGTWAAIITSRVPKGNNPRLHVLVSFLDANEVELWRSELGPL